MSKAMCIACGDIHLSHNPPVARSAEKDWYAAQLRSLSELNSLKSKLQVPVVCTGDVFDDGWRPSRCPAELINFAIDNLPFMFPSHDLRKAPTVLELYIFQGYKKQTFLFHPFYD